MTPSSSARQVLDGLGVGRGRLLGMEEVGIFPKDELAKFCRRNYILKLSLFGSVLREDFRPESDVDVLVIFEKGHPPGFFGLVRMEELSHLLGGRKVDLRTPQDLSHYFREEVLASAAVQYART